MNEKLREVFEERHQTVRKTICGGLYDVTPIGIHWRQKSSEFCVTEMIPVENDKPVPEQKMLWVVNTSGKFGEGPVCVCHCIRNAMLCCSALNIAASKAGEMVLDTILEPKIAADISCNTDYHVSDMVRKMRELHEAGKSDKELSEEMMKLQDSFKRSKKLTLEESAKELISYCSEPNSAFKYSKEDVERVLKVMLKAQAEKEQKETKRSEW